MTIKQEQLVRRLWIHHLPIFIVSALCVFLLYVTRPRGDVVSKISFSTAYPALVLLSLTLLVGPWNLLRRKRTPISSDLRRDIGIWGGILALIHTGIGQNVHLRGRPWLYYVYGNQGHHTFPLRHDLFGFANYTGALSALIIIVLLATSNNFSLRALSTPRWKQLQRWNYAAFALMGAHAVGYQVNEDQEAPFVAIVAASIGVTIVLQAIGFQRRRAEALKEQKNHRGQTAAAQRAGTCGLARKFHRELGSRPLSMA
ncbi:MAG: ferric reductase-like transmembrane domain-containing protein [Terriglobia bacterium]